MSSPPTVASSSLKERQLHARGVSSSMKDLRIQIEGKHRLGNQALRPHIVENWDLAT